MKNSESFDVIVIGGGLAGGICARELCDLGYSVLVIEKEKNPGGL